MRSPKKKNSKESIEEKFLRNTTKRNCSCKGPKEKVVSGVEGKPGSCQERIMLSSQNLDNYQNWDKSICFCFLIAKIDFYIFIK